MMLQHYNWSRRAFNLSVFGRLRKTWAPYALFSRSVRTDTLKLTSSMVAFNRGKRFINGRSEQDKEEASSFLSDDKKMKYQSMYWDGDKQRFLPLDTSKDILCYSGKTRTRLIVGSTILSGLIGGLGLIAWTADVFGFIPLAQHQQLYPFGLIIHSIAVLLLQRYLIKAQCVEVTLLAGGDRAKLGYPTLLGGVRSIEREIKDISTGKYDPEQNPPRYWMFKIYGESRYHAIDRRGSILNARALTRVIPYRFPHIAPTRDIGLTSVPIPSRHREPDTK